MSGLVVVGMLSSAGAAFCAAAVFEAHLEHRKSRDKLLASIDAENDGGVSVLVGGVSSRLIEAAIREGSRAHGDAGVIPPVFGKRVAERVEEAGLAEVVSVEAAWRVVLRSAALCSIVCGLIGLVFSTEAGVLGFVGGLTVGVTALFRALGEERTLRTRAIEAQLSQMLEVVALGMRSGLSFDRSLALYLQHFSGFLRDCFAVARSRWMLGLATREESLRKLSSDNRSPLLSRVIDNIVRSLRFGSSLSESLEASANEARTVNKSRLEERVAKAPVKMLIPVGTLILPAMLLLVLGPIVLDLMQGF